MTFIEEAPQPCNLIDEAALKKFYVERGENVAQSVVRRRAVGEGQKSAQQVRFFFRTVIARSCPASAASLAGAKANLHSRGQELTLSRSPSVSIVE